MLDIVELVREKLPNIGANARIVGRHAGIGDFMTLQKVAENNAGILQIGREGAVVIELKTPKADCRRRACLRCSSSRHRRRP